MTVLGAKGWNLISGSTPAAVGRHAGLLREWFPMLEVARNPVERGLHDFGAVAHVPIALANLGTIDRAEELLFYVEGVSHRTIALLERTEAEFAAVARAYGARLLPMTEVLDRYYGCPATTLLDALRTVEPYRTIAAPTSLDHRFLPRTSVPRSCRCRHSRGAPGCHADGRRRHHDHVRARGRGLPPVRADAGPARLGRARPRRNPAPVAGRRPGGGPRGLSSDGHHRDRGASR